MVAAFACNHPVNKALSSFAETVAAQIRMLEAGQVLHALDHYLADYGVIYVNGAVLGEGLEACRTAQAKLLNASQDNAYQITDLHIDVHSEFCVFRKKTSQSAHIDAQGPETLHVQMWTQGKIAIEWCYSGEPMQGMVARGILKDPAHILELTG